MGPKLCPSQKTGKSDNWDRAIKLSFSPTIARISLRGLIYTFAILLRRDCEVWTFCWKFFFLFFLGWYCLRFFSKQFSGDSISCRHWSNDVIGGGHCSWNIIRCWRHHRLGNHSITTSRHLFIWIIFSPTLIIWIIFSFLVLVLI